MCPPCLLMYGTAVQLSQPEAIRTAYKNLLSRIDV